MVRVDDENFKWMESYRQTLGFPVSNTILANMAITRGRMTPIVIPKPQTNKTKE